MMKILGGDKFMKKTLKFILAFIIGLGIFIIPSHMAKGETNNIENINKIEARDGISNNSIKLLTYHYPWDFKQEWIEFKFVPQGNGTAKLKYYSDGKILNPKDINPNLTLYYDTYFEHGNIYGLNDALKFGRGQYMYNVAEFLENLTFTYGADHFQIHLVSYVMPPDPPYPYRHLDQGIYGARIEGTIHSNLANRDFNEDLRFSGRRELYQFRVEKNGLYAQYKNQVRIPDGEYAIEIAENSYRVLEVGSGNNIGVNNHNLNAPYQKFTLEYDNINMAYKIKTNYGSNNLISWDSTHGNNVISYPDGNYADQFWYLERTNSGTYSLINAKNISRVLNLDANNSNISVSERRNNLKQQFVFSKTSIKKGTWKIITKTSNYHAVSIDIDGPDPRNVLPWVDRNTSQQKWVFEYDSIRDAYLIRNYYNNLVLAWDNNNNSRNVVVKPMVDGGHHYWALEDVGDGYYIFKNYSDHNMVLDLRNGNIGYLGNPGNIQVHERNNGNNQKFKLVR